MGIAMKKKLTWLTVFIAPLLLLSAPGQENPVTIGGDYPASEISNVEGFRFYTTTNVADPISAWQVYTNIGTNSVIITGTNAVFTLTLAPRKTAMFFAVTAYNYAGESPPSPALLVLARPQTAPANLRIQQAP